MDRKITQESPHVWIIHSVKEKDGGARIIMNPDDGFFSIEYDVKWGKYRRYTMPDDNSYGNFQEAYDMADRLLYAVENDLIIID